MVERKEVEALLALVEAEKGRWSPHVPAPALAALCRAWLAVDSGLRVYVGRVYDCDVCEDRGEIIRTLPVDLIGYVRIVKEEGE